MAGVKIVKTLQFAQAGIGRYLFDNLGDDGKHYVGEYPSGQTFMYMHGSGFLTALNAGISAAVVAGFEATLPAFEGQDTSNPNALRVPLTVNGDRQILYDASNAPATGIAWANSFNPSVGFPPNVNLTASSTAGLLGTTTSLVPQQTQQVITVDKTVDEKQRSANGIFDGITTDPILWAENNPVVAAMIALAVYIIVQKYMGKKKVLGIF